MAAAETAKVAAAKAAEIPAGETSPAAVEAMTEIAAMGTGSIAVAKTAIVRRVVAAPTVVAIIATAVRPVTILTSIRIGGGAEDTANYASRGGGSGIRAVRIAASVSPNIMARASVVMGDRPMCAAGDPRMGDVLIVVSDGGCVRRGERREQR